MPERDTGTLERSIRVKRVKYKCLEDKNDDY